MKKSRYAYTMIELIMVIVILGIIAMIATEVTVQAYKGAYYQQKYAEREVELERVLTIIEKRLKDALVDSIVLLDKNGALGVCEVIGTQLDSDDFTAAFIAVDRDSMNGLWNGSRHQNGWSEDANISVVGADTVLTSPDADFNITADTINQIYGLSIYDTAIYRYPMISNACSDFGWNGGTANALNVITHHDSSTRLRINGTAGIGTQQTYRLSSTAYAFKRTSGPAGNLGDGNLTLYWNFRPWQGGNYLNGESSLVAEHISHFAIRIDSGASHSVNGSPSLNGAFYRINVCMKVVNDTNETANGVEDQICKEKSVYVR